MLAFSRPARLVEVGGVGGVAPGILAVDQAVER